MIATGAAALFGGLASWFGGGPRAAIMGEVEVLPEDPPLPLDPGDGEILMGDLYIPEDPGEFVQGMPIPSEDLRILTEPD